jgi:hypothetical protein
MLPSTHTISNLIQTQFPAFYHEEGEMFIEFVKTYFEWLESTDNPLYKSRRLYEFKDIDETPNELVKYFISKYMSGVPKNIIGDVRLLQKHILELYRSKGSDAGLRLLFKLLYNEDITVYVPGNDILKLSDGIWVSKSYIEITDSTLNSSFNEKYIRGSVTGASAYVDYYVKLFLRDKGKIIHVLYVSSVEGTFIPGEKVIYDGISAIDAPFIYGSPGSITVGSTFPYQSNGDIVLANTSLGSGVGLKAVITSTYDAGSANGVIQFNEFGVTDGGSGFTTTPSINVYTGSNTTGFGATFTGVTLTNEIAFTYNTDRLLPNIGILINATNYGANLNFANVTNVLNDALHDITGPIGTISGMTGVDPGHNYNGYVNVHVREDFIAGYGYLDANGHVIGDNAIIESKVIVGNGIPDRVAVKNSGMGYYVNGESITLINQSSPSKSVTGSINLVGVGQTEGFWQTSQGKLDEDKYVQDSFYYQEYSYEIRASKSIDKYLQTLKDVTHPAGNRPFGRVLLTRDKSMPLQVVYSSVNQT